MSRPRGRRPGPVRGRVAAVRAMRPRTPTDSADPRILGHSAFVARLLHEAAAPQRPRALPAERATRATGIIRAACAKTGITLDELAAGSRRGPLPALRASLARELVTRLGLSLAESPGHLGHLTGGAPAGRGESQRGKQRPPLVTDQSAGSDLRAAHHPQPGSLAFGHPVRMPTLGLAFPPTSGCSAVVPVFLAKPYGLTWDTAAKVP